MYCHVQSLDQLQLWADISYVNCTFVNSFDFHSGLINVPLVCSSQSRESVWIYLISSLNYSSLLQKFNLWTHSEHTSCIILIHNASLRNNTTGQIHNQQAQSLKIITSKICTKKCEDLAAEGEINPLICCAAC